MKRILVFMLLALLLTMPAAAQEQRTIDRIDQAMTHLTAWLNRETPITRQTAFWAWQEVIYGDAAFGCGYPGVAYANTPDRAFQITITVEGSEYDYRVSGEGDILVLCGADGLPLYRSDLAPGLGVVSTADSADWYAMIYTDSTDLIRLLTPAGEVNVYQRPTVGTEAIPRQVDMAVSPNGRYLVQAVLQADGNEVLGIYDFQTDTQRTIAAQPGEEIALGSPAFNSDSTQIAVSFGLFELGDTVTNQWRLAIIDLTTGTIRAQIDDVSINTIITDTDTELDEALNNVTSIFFAHPALWEDSGGVHFRLVAQFVGGALDYAGFVWFPADGTASISPYGRVGDILPTTGAPPAMVYASVDPTLPIVPPDGPFPALNAISVGIPAADAPGELTQTQIHADGNFNHLSPLWAAAGDLVLMRVAAENSDFQWALKNVRDDTSLLVLSDTYTDVAGVPDGFLALTEFTDAGADVIFQQGEAVGTIIATIPPQNGRASFLWTQPANVGFYAATPAITANTVLEPSNITPPPGAPVLCEGTPPSIISVGTQARATITDGAPLNTRQGPGVSQSIVQILPEGTQFTVIGGPQCADGFTWWNIELPGPVFAWAAEGDSDTYFIEPLPTQ